MTNEQWSEPLHPWGRTMSVFLLGAVATGLAATWIKPGTPEAIRIAVGLPMVLLAPGYFTSKALFPRRSARSAEGVALTLAISIAQGILITLLLNLLPWGLSTASWTIGLGSVVTLAAAVAAYRQPSARTSGVRRASLRWHEKTLIAIAIVVLVGSLAASRQPLAPPSAVHGYSELWLVHEGDHLRIGVASLELHSTRYQLEVVAAGRPLSEYSLSLRPRGTWSKTIPDQGVAVEARLWLVLPSGDRTLYRDVQSPSARAASS